MKGKGIIIIIVLCSLGIAALAWYYWKYTGLESVTGVDPKTGLPIEVKKKPLTEKELAVLAGDGRGAIDDLNSDRG